MYNILDFTTFNINERRYLEKYSAIDKARERIDSLTPEVNWLYKGSKGGDWLTAVADNPEGGLKRLLVGAVQGLLGISQSISDKFGNPDIKSKSKDYLVKNREETLEKWGENIEKSGKNKINDFEDFYKDAIFRGKKTFGNDFNIRKPKSEDEKIYVDYIENAFKYYDKK